MHLCNHYSLIQSKNYGIHLKKIIDKLGVGLDESAHSDMKKIMEVIGTKAVGDTNSPFREMFWSQQLTSDSRQMKWKYVASVQQVLRDFEGI